MASLNLVPFCVKSISEHNKVIFVEGVIFGSDMGQLIPSAISFRYQLGVNGEFSDVITINSSNVIIDFMQWFTDTIEPLDTKIHIFTYVK